MILHAPTYNDPVYLTGRRTFLGYPGHVWSHGIDYGPREAELKRIYMGAADAPALFGDELEAIVRWKNPAELAALAGKPIRLRFVLKYADVYANPKGHSLRVFEGNEKDG